MIGREQQGKNVIVRATLLLFIIMGFFSMMAYLHTYNTPAQLLHLPIVINTWTFINATRVAYRTMQSGGVTERIALDGIEKGCNWCEAHPDHCDFTVGYGGSPNEWGQTTLDAMVMWGPTREVGAVGYMKRVKPAISVARKVMERTYHTILVGDEATTFAVEMGFEEEDLNTTRTAEMWREWKAAGRKPNFWKGPHNSTQGVTKRKEMNEKPEFGRWNHDTIGMVAIDQQGNVACGVSSNGATWKIPGRVGDAPIVGSGAYCENEVGGAAETGDGDVMMRFSPSNRVVQMMKGGMHPKEACERMVAEILRYYPNCSGAIIAVNKQGQIGAAYMNLPNGFPFCLQNSNMKDAAIITIKD
ncbi:N(4)-(beta-N-acetylglucosaminyl)-L-asparaginase-like [Planoprotostelium fungivorum]|uniref:N(4)-(Beta-N-acetylglucosaminyl)-L-asparaginase-like n=1 Tax=Planoprotostelium fungivorum TaxID=1890364 RepID=A0A2P6NLB5_9EUKA|nr:N(4)-(beta-N-acetylglucosaminyl)-L-asparaginase-like [Planoprotostelium fungivorum]